MKFITCAAAALLSVMTVSGAEKTTVINVKPVKGDATVTLQKAIDRAAKMKGRAVEIKLAPGVYNISRTKATPRLYFVSNTTTVQENPDNTKHVGLLMRGISNLTIDGGGAKIITHGEMTPWAIDSCSNVTLRNFTIDAADPSVPEMTVTAQDMTSMTARVHPRSKYEIRDGKLYWQGEGWEFTDGIAQIYSPTDSTTLRTDSPIEFSQSVEEIEPGLVKFTFKRKMPDVTGMTYQMRHSFRTEVAGLICNSSDVTLESLNLQFMGNFGIVAQMSNNVTYRKLRCAPDAESGRTCTGFADFLQVSGCGGHVAIEDCYFAGSHDDPINVHGTHLRIVGHEGANKLKVRFMHGQTRGFRAFFAGDSVAIVDSRSLQRRNIAVLKDARLISDFEMELTLDRDVPAELLKLKDAVVENITWSPSVNISRCYFTLTPTRGILITTWRPVVIEDCTFFRCPMSSVLIADDARSWYEAGPAHNVVIKDNRFIDCVSPVILVAPEASVNDGPVHENISIRNNTFENTGRFQPSNPSAEIRARLVKNLEVKGNTVIAPSRGATLKVNTESCSPVTIE